VRARVRVSFVHVYMYVYERENESMSECLGLGVNFNFLWYLLMPLDFAVVISGGTKRGHQSLRKIYAHSRYNFIEDKNDLLLCLFISANTWQHS